MRVATEPSLTGNTYGMGLDHGRSMAHEGGVLNQMIITQWRTIEQLGGATPYICGLLDGWEDERRYPVKQTT